MKKVIVFSLAIFVILIDQLTKFEVMAHLVPYESINVLPILSWTLAFNSGSAFSLLAESGSWHTWFFMGFTSLVSLGLVIWIVRLETRLFSQMLALALILGGALGNLVDRIRLGYVIDFIDIYYKNYHWPVFNVADSAICIGAVWLAVIWLREKD